MELHHMGINTREGGDFMIDRPYGSGDYLFLIFKTEAILTQNDETIHLTPDSCILYTPTAKQLYGICGGTYVNHYVHFGIDDTELKDFEDFPFNQPFYIENASEVESILQLLARAQISTTPNRERSISLLLKLLLTNTMDSHRTERPSVEKRHTDKLVSLRSSMYSDAGKYRSVQDLANEVNISLSYFQGLYKAQFQTSCYDDLLTAKTMTAQHLLSTTNLPIKEVAILCGYDEETCFMRQFKKRTGMTPSGYRKNQG